MICNDRNQVNVSSLGLEFELLNGKGHPLSGQKCFLDVWTAQ